MANAFHLIRNDKAGKRMRSPPLVGRIQDETSIIFPPFVGGDKGDGEEDK
jgi:hypothetical protein